MIKRLIASLALALAACAPVPVAPVAPSFNDQVAKAIQEITYAREASTQLLIAKAITLKQDQTAQLALTEVKNHIQDALVVNLSDPAQAAKLLADALQTLATFQGAKQ